MALEVLFCVFKIVNIYNINYVVACERTGIIFQNKLFLLILNMESEISNEFVYMFSIVNILT